MDEDCWEELGDGVYRLASPVLRLNVGVVVGGRRVLLVDDGWSQARGEWIRDRVRERLGWPVAAVVNTHAHWDHVFGNAAFPDARLWAHPRVREELVAAGAAARAAALAWLPPARRPEVAATAIVPPDRAVVGDVLLDLGGRRVVLAHRGPGHTRGDVIVAVPDAGVAFAGDLLEEGSPPAFEDADPLRWPRTLRALRLDTYGRVVPGHGDVMDPTGVRRQVARLEAVAAWCRRHLEDRDPRGGPYPAATMRVALVRARVVTGRHPSRRAGLTVRRARRGGGSRARPE